jgi:fibronectin type 3 domain-containing protein
MRDGAMLTQAEEKVLAEKVSARPLNDWEEIVQHNDYAAVVAQALYGEDVELSGGEEGFARIYALSQELEQRFALALYAADQNFDVACMAGWGWEDTDVKPNEYYLYRIIPLLPENDNITVEIGIAYTSTAEYEELPVPIGLTGIWGDKTVLLAWDYGTLSDVYNSYYIERSNDGERFNRLEGIPVTNINNTEDRATQRMYYIDSIADNTSPYYYRIVGITTFGETGPPSDTISGQGKQMLTYVPHITRSVVNDDGVLELEWEFDERGNELISGFTLDLSDNPNDGFLPVVADIPPVSRSLTFDRLNASNYFTITAIPKEGEPASSFPVLVQPIDSIPPAIPTGLKGAVDSTGIVTLTWNKNTEPDLLGYKVYRAFTKGEELMPLFDLAWESNTYCDTISVHNLNSKVYYAISAADMRYNQSDMTPVLELEKPDLIRPSSPVISGYKIKDEGIEISWINSPDEGVILHNIYRERKRDSIGAYIPLLTTISDTTITSYIDTEATPNTRYVYSVTAVKKNGLESDASNMLTAFTNKVKPQGLVIDRFDAIVDKPNRMLKLIWVDKLLNVRHYEIYKGMDEKGVSLWRTIPANRYDVLDEDLYVSVTYKYIIRAILQDGKNTLSKELIIKY